MKEKMGMIQLVIGIVLAASLAACTAPSQTVETKNTVVVKENPNDKTIQKERAKKAKAKKKADKLAKEKEPEATNADDNPDEEILLSQVEGNRLFDHSLMSDNLRKAVKKMQELTEFRLKDPKMIVVLTEETTESVRLQVFKRANEKEEKLTPLMALRYDITLDQLEGKEPGQKDYSVIKAKDPQAEKKSEENGQTLPESEKNDADSDQANK